MAPLKADETPPLGRTVGATLQPGSEVPLASAVSAHAWSGGALA